MPHNQTPALTADHSAPADTQFQDLKHRSGHAPADAFRSAVNQPDLSGYDRSVRSAKFRPTLQRAAAAQPFDDADHEARNRFHDRNATPFTEMEKWFVRMVIAGVVAVVVCVVMLVRS